MIRIWRWISIEQNVFYGQKQDVNAEACTVNQRGSKLAR